MHCRAEGSWSVGVSVTVLSSKPTASSTGASSKEGFQQYFVVRNSPTSLTTALHHVRHRDGSVRGYQVGG